MYSALTSIPSFSSLPTGLAATSAASSFSSSTQAATAGSSALFSGMRPRYMERVIYGYHMPTSKVAQSDWEQLQQDLLRVQGPLNTIEFYSDANYRVVALSRTRDSQQDVDMDIEELQILLSNTLLSAGGMPPSQDAVSVQRRQRAQQAQQILNQYLSARTHVHNGTHSSVLFAGPNGVLTSSLPTRYHISTIPYTEEQKQNLSRFTEHEKRIKQFLQEYRKRRNDPLVFQSLFAIEWVQEF